MALLMVLWVVAFFSVVLSAFAFSMRTELDAARNFKEEAEAASLAEAGVARAMAELVNVGVRCQMSDVRCWTLPVIQHPASSIQSEEIPLGRGTYQVVVTDEEGKIPLNRAPAEVLQRLLQNTGVTDPRLLNTLVDSILDWRDPDNLRRLSGAEEDYYRFLPQPYHPKNGDFETLEELLLVKGMTREILYGNIDDQDRLAALLRRSPEERDLRPGEYLGIRPFLTVRSSGQVNLNTASLEVLVALGFSSSEAQAILQSRKEAPMRGRLPRAPQGLSFTTLSRTYTIESIGRLHASPIGYRIAALVVNEGAPGRPRFKVVAWEEGFK
ncbi:MAG: general secretion pathway protein GspK [Candidatus Methylomirabilales bacterium]